MKTGEITYKPYANYIAMKGTQEIRIRWQIDERKDGGSYEPSEKKVWLSIPTPTMHGEELTHIMEAYNTNWMSKVGESINEAEWLTCETVGCKYAVALSAGTAAWHLYIKLAGIKPGDKVIAV